MLCFNRAYRSETALNVLLQWLGFCLELWQLLMPKLSLVVLESIVWTSVLIGRMVSTVGHQLIAFKSIFDYFFLEIAHFRPNQTDC